MADADFDFPREICANLDSILIRCGAPKIQFGITDTSSYGDHRQNRFRKSDQMELVLPSCLWHISTNNRFAASLRLAGLSSALIIRFVHFGSCSCVDSIVIYCFFSASTNNFPNGDVPFALRCHQLEINIFTENEEKRQMAATEFSPFVSNSRRHRRPSRFGSEKLNFYTISQIACDDWHRRHRHIESNQITWISLGMGTWRVNLFIFFSLESKKRNRRRHQTISCFFVSFVLFMFN